jgi:hypothetical protein
MSLPIRSFVIISTRYVVPPRRFQETPYLEIIAGPNYDDDAPRVTLITRDETLADRAIALEGFDERVVLTWKKTQVRSRPRLVLEAIA